MRSVITAIFLVIFVFLAIVYASSIKKTKELPIPTPTAMPTQPIEEKDAGQEATLVLSELTAMPSPTLYEVKAGDTLYQIALDHNLTLEQLVTANSSIDPNNLKIGQQILIPTP